MGHEDLGIEILMGLGIEILMGLGIEILRGRVRIEVSGEIWGQRFLRDLGIETLRALEILMGFGDIDFKRIWR